jgi:hypothetical protein
MADGPAVLAAICPLKTSAVTTRERHRARQGQQPEHEPRPAHPALWRVVGAQRFDGRHADSAARGNERGYHAREHGNDGADQGGNKVLVVNQVPGDEAVVGHRGDQLPSGRLGREQAKTCRRDRDQEGLAEHQAP